MVKPPLTSEQKEIYQIKINKLAGFQVDIIWFTDDLPLHPTFDPTKLKGKQSSDYSVLRNQLLSRTLKF